MALAQRKLTRDEIVVTARALLAEVGVEGLTMRRLGQACGMSGPALYWHFKDKDALIGEIVDSVVGDLDGGPRDNPWDVRVMTIARSMRALLLAHPGLAIAVSNGYALPERVLDGLDEFVSDLVGAGFTYRESLAVHFSVLTSVIGFVIYEGASPTFGAIRTPLGSPERARSRATFEELAGDRLPHLRGIAGALDEVTVDELFESSLGSLVQGWADRLEATR